MVSDSERTRAQLAASEAQDKLDVWKAVRALSAEEFVVKWRVHLKVDGSNISAVQDGFAHDLYAMVDMERSNYRPSDNNS